MKISDYLSEDLIFFDIKEGRNKSNILKQITDRICRVKKFSPDKKKKIISNILERERLGSTAIGQGIALPHARVNFVKTPIISITSFKNGVDLGALDGDKVFLVFLIVSPQKSEGLHLKILANISRLLRDKFFLAKLKNAKSPEEIKKAIKSQERKV